MFTRKRGCMQHKKMKNITKVYGIRNCVSCKGIIHEKAFRTKIGQRKRYFCSKQCVEQYMEKRLQKHFPKTFKMLVKSLKKATEEYLKNSLESVFVITK